MRIALVAAFFLFLSAPSFAQESPPTACAETPDPHLSIADFAFTNLRGLGEEAETLSHDFEPSELVAEYDLSGPRHRKLILSHQALNRSSAKTSLTPLLTVDTGEDIHDIGLNGGGVAYRLNLAFVRAQQRQSQIRIENKGEVPVFFEVHRQGDKVGQVEEIDLRPHYLQDLVVAASAVHFETKKMIRLPGMGNPADFITVTEISVNGTGPQKAVLQSVGAADDIMETLGDAQARGASIHFTFRRGATARLIRLEAGGPFFTYSSGIHVTEVKNIP